MNTIYNSETHGADRDQRAQHAECQCPPVNKYGHVMRWVHVTRFCRQAARSSPLEHAPESAHHGPGDEIRDQPQYSALNRNPANSSHMCVSFHFAIVNSIRHDTRIRVMMNDMMSGRLLYHARRGRGVRVDRDSARLPLPPASCAACAASRQPSPPPDRHLTAT